MHLNSGTFVSLLDYTTKDSWVFMYESASDLATVMTMSDIKLFLLLFQQVEHIRDFESNNCS
jgi:hypothetical protein